MYLRNELDCHLPIFLIVSYDTPLLANHEAAPIRKECVLKCVVGRFRAVIALLCSPKNFGGAYSRRFVRASVRPCVRASVRPCVRPALVHANSRKLLVGFQ